MKKAIVIGAGVGGLATAIRLAKRGFEVKVFEKSNQVGGKCRLIKQEGFTFDAGPSLVTIPAVYRDLFMKSGARLEHLLRLEPVDPAFSYHFPDGTTVKLSNLSVKKNADEIAAALGEKEGNAWHNLMQRAERMWDISRNPFIESEIRLKKIVREISLPKLRAIAPFTSLSKYVSKFSKNQKLRDIVYRYATYSGSDPRKAPAVLLTIPFIEATFGAWHFAGGVGRLSEELQKRALDLNVEIHLEAEVCEVLVKANQVQGIKLKNGEEISAQIVISNIDAKLLYGSLIKDRSARTARERAKLKIATPAFSGFSIFLGLDNQKINGELPQLEHHNVFFPKNYENEFVEIFDTKKPVSDPAIYICAPNDPLMTPGKNFESWSVLVNAPLHEPEIGLDWRKFEVEYAQKIINKLDVLGLKVSERITYMSFRSPADLEAEFSAPGGSIYGTSSNGALAAFARAKNRSKISGLYLVGGSAHPGGGLPLVGISSEIVSELIS